MALSLDPILASVQTSQSRNPRIEIISSQAQADIPFDGQFLTTETTDEKSPNLILHSSGRLCPTYLYGTNKIKYVYTSDDRTIFNFAVLSIPIGHTIHEAALCEMEDGNIGILYRTSSGTNSYIRYKILSVDGSELADDLIITVGSSPWISGPFVTKLSDGTFLAFYTWLDSTTYKFIKLTSENFLSWSSAEASIGSLDSSHKIANPFLSELIGGDIFLSFDYCASAPGETEISNIYYSISSDLGENWGSAVQNTTYPDVTAIASHPVMTQKIANQIYLAFTRSTGALSVAGSTDGFCGTGYSGAGDLSFNPATRKLYSIWYYWGAGTPHPLRCVTEIDVDTWLITRCWGSSSTPAFSAAFFAQDVIREKNHGEGYFIPVGISNTYGIIEVLNAQENIVVQYAFRSWLAYSITQNVNHSLPGIGESLTATWIDSGTNRLYLLFSYGGSGNVRIWIGYIDLTAPGPTYTYNEIVSNHRIIPVFAHSYGINFSVFPGEDSILVWTLQYPDERVALKIFNISSGAEVKNYNFEDFSDFPRAGTRSAVLNEGKIFLTFPYTAGFSQEDFRGVCQIDTADDSITYFRPTWDTLDDYNLGRISKMPDGRLLVASSGEGPADPNGYGITIFDPMSGEWTLYNDSSLPGMDPLGTDDYTIAIYDPLTDMIYAGQPSGRDWAHFAGSTIMFSSSGLIRQSNYRIGNYAGGVWTWGAINPLVLGYLEYDAAIIAGPGTEGIYGFWTHLLSSEYSIKWDREGSTLDLSDFIAKNRDITISRSIDGKPSELNFTMAAGELFDSTNSYSLYSVFMEKGRWLTVRIGESIGGTVYWQNQGTFIIAENKLVYQRKIYPEMQIRALDKKILWEQKQILASEWYNTDPLSILEDILEETLGEVSGDITIPEFDTAVTITHQWMDIKAKEILDQLCDRFGYFLRITVDNKISARKISDSNPVDHIYSNLNENINYGPDDSFSDFVNQIMVVGYEQTEIEVLFPEERISAINGTVGWWGFKKDYTIYYSDDRTRRARNPRLKVLESSTSIGFKLSGGITESISYIDVYDQYCVITVEAPNLIALLISNIAVLVANYFAGDAVLYGSWTRPVGTLIQMIAIVTLNMILGAIGNFQYEIWARPLGLIRRTIQGTADDPDFQAKIGSVIPENFDDPLCGSVPQCKEVAEQILLVKRLQRKRGTFKKSADLRDEEGDTIQFPHPVSGETMTFFITDIVRRMRIPSSGQTGGEFVDEIQGWRL